MKVGESPAQQTIHQQATSLWQSAERGMRSIQGSFPRLKGKMLFSQDMADRKAFLHMILTFEHIMLG
jgi:hypothetical protein